MQYLVPHLDKFNLAQMDGREVAVKVKRPGIEKIIKQDVAVLKRIFPIALRFVDPNLGFSAKGMLEQFEESIREELDYTAESKNLKEIKDNVAKYDDVVIPQVYDEMSTKNVLTMEYLAGTKVTDIESLERMGIDRKKLVLDVHRVFFRMLLSNAIFHADPAPDITDTGRAAAVVRFFTYFVCRASSRNFFISGASETASRADFIKSLRDVFISLAYAPYMRFSSASTCFIILTNWNCIWCVLYMPSIIEVIRRYSARFFW